MKGRRFGDNRFLRDEELFGASFTLLMVYSNMQINYPLSILTKLVRSVPDGCEIFHVHGSYGDIYIQISILKEIALTGRKIAVVVDAIYSDLVMRAGENLFTTVVTANGHFVDAALTSIGLLGRQDGLPTRMQATLYPFVTDLMKVGSLAYVDFMRVVARSAALGPLEQLENSNWHREAATQLLTEAGVPAGETVLLMCDNNTHIEFSEEFWLNVATLVSKAGLIPCLNVARTSGSRNLPELLRNVDALKQILIPPHLAVSVAAACGFYVIGTNGFGAIQALFNERAKGLHLINCTESHAGTIREKGGGEHPIQSLYHERAFRGLNRGGLKEVEVYTNAVPAEAAEMISNAFQFD